MYIWSMPKQKRPFVVEIEAKLTVYAFDEDSARKKVEKAFASGRPLGVDVDAGAGVWTYAVVPQEQAPGS
jgi:sugar lactone lactonase YvrE